jgi:hypothetical protein
MYLFEKGYSETSIILIHLRGGDEHTWLSIHPKPYGVIKIFLYENLIDKSWFTCQPGEHVSMTWLRVDQT